MATSVEFSLLETILFVPSNCDATIIAAPNSQGFVLLEGHLRRLQRSLQFFSHLFTDPPSNEQIILALVSACADWKQYCRVRLLVHRPGVISVETHTFSPFETNTCLSVVLDPFPIRSTDIFLRYKTTHRVVYDNARARNAVGTPEGPFDAVLQTPDGYLTEATIANIALERSPGYWITPPLAAGLLPGVYREFLLEQGSIHEAQISIEDLKTCLQAGARLKCFNALRGEYFVQLKLQ